MTNKQYKEYFKRATILIDTREQQYKHITDYLDKKGYAYERTKLDSGDYSFRLDEDYSDKIIIERKANLDELANNFTKKREQFKAEFARSGARKILMVEYGSISQIIKGQYRSELKSVGYWASMMAFRYRYDIDIDFVSKIHSGQYIISQFYYWLRERMVSR